MPDSAANIWRELAWQSAAALGVSSTVPGGVDAVVDPEAVLVLGAVVEDARLHGELLDWALVHAPLLMSSRLRRIAADAAASSIAEQWIATIDQHAESVTWRSTAPPMVTFEPSGKSTSYDAYLPAAAALRARALGGATARTELLRALHPTTRSGTPRDRTAIVHDAAIAASQAPRVIEELITARLLRRSGSARRQQLVAFRGDDGDLASGYWAAWSRLSPAPWRDAPRIAERLLSLDRDAPADGSRTWAAHIVERTLPAFVTVADLGGPSYEAARGTTLQVHDAARGHARRASAWLAARLRYGIG